MVSRLSDIDWSAWRPADVATLIFIIRGGEVLLIRKLRGLGQGKINAPGGRQEPGETLAETAIREAREEVGVTPHSPRFRGELRFAFTDGYHLECHVFSSDGGDGEAHPSAEAIPIWTPLSAIPYDEMWADDRLWLPLMLAGRTPFSGRFVFSGEAMLDHALSAHDPAEPLYAHLFALGVAHDTHAHPPVFTVDEAKRHRPAGAAGHHTKNLFLRNKKGRMWLVTLHEDRPVDLRELGRRLDAGNLSFASPARLRAHLGVEPGSVTPLALINDTAREVGFVLDAALASAPSIWCHPLTNDRTTHLATADFLRFVESTGHPLQLLD